MAISLPMVGAVAVGVGLVVYRIRSARSQAEAAYQEQLESLFQRQPGWRKQPTAPKSGTLYADKREWSAYGQTSAGVHWEAFLVHDKQSEGPDYLYLRAFELELPQLELMLGEHRDVAKFQAYLPQIKSAANSMLGKMALPLIERACQSMGFSVQEMLDFLETAQEQPVGSERFRKEYTLLTRGTVPMEKLITPKAEEILLGFLPVRVTARWGRMGLQLQVPSSRRKGHQQVEALVRLGGLLTGEA